MPRPTKEWVGKNDAVKPHREVYFRIFEKANGRCTACQIKVGIKRGDWAADHIVRLKDGGPNRESNLQVLCTPCHLQKTGEENKLQAKANRVKARHIGVPKKPRSTWINRDGRYKYDWKAGRYKKDV